MSFASFLRMGHDLIVFFLCRHYSGNAGLIDKQNFNFSLSLLLFIFFVLNLLYCFFFHVSRSSHVNSNLKFQIGDQKTNCKSNRKNLNAFLTILTILRQTKSQALKWDPFTVSHLLDPMK